MTKLELISYEESRLAFFEQQLAGANGKLDWAIKHNKSHWDCAEKGEIVSFYQDIVEMLREQAEREKGCVWCRDDNQVTHNGEHFCFFCSYCGKRLEVEP